MDFYLQTMSPSMNAALRRASITGIFDPAAANAAVASLLPSPGTGRSTSRGRSYAPGVDAIPEASEDDDGASSLGRRPSVASSLGAGASFGPAAAGVAPPSLMATGHSSFPHTASGAASARAAILGGSAYASAAGSVATLPAGRVSAAGAGAGPAYSSGLRQTGVLRRASPPPAGFAAPAALFGDASAPLVSAVPPGAGDRDARWRTGGAGAGAAATQRPGGAGAGASQAHRLLQGAPQLQLQGAPHGSLPSESAVASTHPTALLRQRDMAEWSLMVRDRLAGTAAATVAAAEAASARDAAGALPSLRLQRGDGGVTSGGGYASALAARATAALEAEVGSLARLYAQAENATAAAAANSSSAGSGGSGAAFALGLPLPFELRVPGPAAQAASARAAEAAARSAVANASTGHALVASRARAVATGEAGAGSSSSSGSGSGASHAHGHLGQSLAWVETPLHAQSGVLAPSRIADADALLAAATAAAARGASAAAAAGSGAGAHRGSQHDSHHHSSHSHGHSAGAHHPRVPGIAVPHPHPHGHAHGHGHSSPSHGAAASGANEGASGSAASGSASAAAAGAGAGAGAGESAVHTHRDGSTSAGTVREKSSARPSQAQAHASPAGSVHVRRTSAQGAQGLGRRGSIMRRSSALAAAARGQEAPEDLIKRARALAAAASAAAGGKGAGAASGTASDAATTGPSGDAPADPGALAASIHQLEARLAVMRRLQSERKAAAAAATGDGAGAGDGKRASQTPGRLRGQRGSRTSALSKGTGTVGRDRPGDGHGEAGSYEDDPRGYVDEATGEWIPDERGWYDEETGEWVPDERGFFDEEVGEWVPDDRGFYDEAAGEWVPDERGFFDEEAGEWTYDERGFFDPETDEWVHDERGYYDEETGQWVHDERGFFDHAGGEGSEWIPDARGYYDESAGTWIPDSRGYYDGDGNWVPTLDAHEQEGYGEGEGYGEEQVAKKSGLLRRVGTAVARLFGRNASSASGNGNGNGPVGGSDGAASSRAEVAGAPEGDLGAEWPGPEDPPDAVLKGFLAKCGSRDAFWRRRFCVLTTTELRYYGSREDAGREAAAAARAGPSSTARPLRLHKGAVDLSAANLLVGAGAAKSGAPTRFCFRLDVGRRVFTFAAASEATMLSWIGALARVTHTNLRAVLSAAGPEYAGMLRLTADGTGAMPYGPAAGLPTYDEEEDEDGYGHFDDGTGAQYHHHHDHHDDGDGRYHDEHQGYGYDGASYGAGSGPQAHANPDRFYHGYGRDDGSLGRGSTGTGAGTGTGGDGYYDRSGAGGRAGAGGKVGFAPAPDGYSGVGGTAYRDSYYAPPGLVARTASRR